MLSDQEVQIEQWQYEFLPVVDKGLDKSIDTTLVEKDALLKAENVYFHKRGVKKDLGYSSFGDTVRGDPRICFQFFKQDGTDELILITDATFYAWLQDEWQYRSNGTDTTTSASASAGATSITVNDITGFSDGDYIGIILDDSSQHQTTVNGTPSGSTINISDAIPAGRSVPSGAAVVNAVSLSGSSSIQVSVVTSAANDWLIFTNGVDTVKRYDGATVEDVPNLPSSGNTTCRTVNIFKDHLLLMHTTEGGTAHPQRIRWSDTGDFTNWSTGNASYEDKVDTEDFITASAQLGPYMVAYKERSIIRGEYIGSDDQLFNWETVVAGEGVLSQDSVVDLGDYHIFFGNSNIYEYRAGYDIEPIGDKVYDLLYGNDGDINSAQKQKIFGFYVEELDEIWMFYPSSGSDVTDTLLRYNAGTKSYSRRYFDVTMIGFGFYQRTTDLTWNDLTGDWTQQLWAWNSRSVLSNSPTILICGNDNQIYEYDYTTTDDNGTAIAYDIETKDFGTPNFDTRFNRLDLRLSGSNVNVQYSTDEGVTWINFTDSPITTTGIENVSLHDQFVGKYFRLRMYGSGGFNLISLGFEYMLESETRQ